MRLNIKFIISVVCYFFAFLIIVIQDFNGQDAKDLERKKAENVKQLAIAKDLLDKTNKSKTYTLNQLNLIQQNIEIRTEIISDVTSELAFLKNDINENNSQINQLELKIKLIKEDYTRLIRATYKSMDNDYTLLYLFSSQDFNQAYQRLRYLKYLSEYRIQLVEELKNEDQILKDKNLELFENRKKNERLLVERRTELNSLDENKKQNLALINVLQSKEAELKSDIRNKERIQDEIEREIRRIIEEEAARAREARKGNYLSEADKFLSSGFLRNEGKLPWPTEKGIITGKYGEQNHPVLKGIKIKSNGIDINTSEGALVQSIYDGEVTKVIAILGANYTVIIRHGDFRTVYQNLVDVRVTAGEKVKAKTILGKVFTDDEGVSKFHFELWKDKTTQNPELWIIKH